MIIREHSDQMPNSPYRCELPSEVLLGVPQFQETKAETLIKTPFSTHPIASDCSLIISSLHSPWGEYFPDSTASQTYSGYALDILIYEDGVGWKPISENSGTIFGYTYYHEYGDHRYGSVNFIFPNRFDPKCLRIATGYDEGKSVAFWERMRIKATDVILTHHFSHKRGIFLVPNEALVKENRNLLQYRT